MPTKQRQFLVYKNRFDEVKPYEVELLFSNAETLEVFDIVEAKDKTFLKKNILGEYKSFAEAKHHSEEKQKDYVMPYFVHDDPYEASEEELLRAKWLHEQKILNGDFRPA